MRDIKSRKRWVTSGLLFLVAALIGALVLTACAGGGGGGGGGNQTTPHPWIVRYGFQAAGLSSTLGIDPQTVGAGMVAAQTAEGMSRIDPNTLEVVPGLATSWEAAPDHSYIDYTIRQGVKFHNGDLMTAEDVKFTYDSCLDEDRMGTGAVEIQAFIDHVEIIGTDHVRVYLKKFYWSALLGTPVIIPKNYIENLVEDLGKAEGWLEWANKPVLTGPFKIVDWERDVYVHYVKAFPEEGHWYYGTDIPNYDELYIYSVVEPSTRLAMLKTGELDASHIAPPNVLDVQNDPKLNLVMSEYSASWNVIFYDMGFPETPSPLLDPNVRKAVSLAIDREGIAKNVFHDTYKPWGSYWSPNILGYRYKEPDPYDPTEAKRLLTEAGYPDGFDTVFSYPMNYADSSAAVIASLATVGIKAQARGYDAITWGTMIYYKQHTGMGMFPYPWWDGARYPDSVWGIESFLPPSRDIPGVKDIYEQMNKAANEEELKQAAWAAEDLVFEVGWKITVWAINAAFAYGPTVENWRVGWPGDENTQSLVLLQYKG